MIKKSEPDEEGGEKEEEEGGGGGGGEKPKKQPETPVKAKNIKWQYDAVSIQLCTKIYRILGGTKTN